MLVFAALLLVTGMAGDYFYPIAYNVPIAMLASIVVAYIVTPWAANRWVKRPAPTGGILDDGSEAESEANTHEERSEEHTSELQSLMRISYAVFCLKKKI